MKAESMYEKSYPYRERRMAIPIFFDALLNRRSALIFAGFLFSLWLLLLATMDTGILPLAHILCATSPIWGSIILVLSVVGALAALDYFLGRMRQLLGFNHYINLMALLLIVVSLAAVGYAFGLMGISRHPVPSYVASIAEIYLGIMIAFPVLMGATVVSFVVEIFMGISSLRRARRDGEADLKKAFEEIAQTANFLSATSSSRDRRAFADRIYMLGRHPSAWILCARRNAKGLSTDVSLLDMAFLHLQRLVATDHGLGPDGDIRRLISLWQDLPLDEIVQRIARDLGEHRRHQPTWVNRILECLDPWTPPWVGRYGPLIKILVTSAILLSAICHFGEALLGGLVKVSHAIAAMDIPMG